MTFAWFESYLHCSALYEWLDINPAYAASESVVTPTSHSAFFQDPQNYFCGSNQLPIYVRLWETHL